MTRRQAAKTAALTALSYSRVFGANNRIGFGIIGLGERGSYVGGLFTKNDDVELLALCDIYGKRLDAARQKGLNGKPYAKHEDLLAHPGLDAVLPGSFGRRGTESG